MMTKMSKYLFSFCVVLVFSCNNSSDKNEKATKALSGSLTKITLDHVIEKREGCRFTTFYFELVLNNKTSESQQVEMPPAPDHCERDISESKIWWVNETEKKPLTLASSKYDKVITVGANEQKKIELKGVFRVWGESLDQISSIYEDWFKSAEIVYHGNKLSIEKAKDFKLVFLLDGQQVTPSDSAAFNKAISSPNLEADTLLDESQVPTTEPELQ